jgi:hypothetical protein
VNFHLLNAREFKANFRVTLEIFAYICTKLGPILSRQDTVMREAIPLQVRVSVGLIRLATGCTYQVVGSIFHIAPSTCHCICVAFINALDSVLKREFVRWPSMSRMKEIAKDFESLHHILDVVGAVDGSHIPIIAPQLHAADYYNRKGFHFVLLHDANL